MFEREYTLLDQSNALNSLAISYLVNKINEFVFQHQFCLHRVINDSPQIFSFSIKLTYTVAYINYWESSMLVQSDGEIHAHRLLCIKYQIMPIIATITYKYSATAIDLLSSANTGFGLTYTKLIIDIYIEKKR